MTTEARITANRRNAKKSTGPRTLEGKAIVAQNAIKHGFLAKQDLIAGEDPQEYALCRDRLLGELTPVGEMETILAERIVSLAWRLKRAQRLQNQLFDYLLARDLEQSLYAFDDEVSQQDVQDMTSDPEMDPHLAIGRVIAHDYGNSQVLDRLTLNERRIENSLYRTMGELRRGQLARAQGVCSVSAKASHVAQPPSAGITAGGGGAPCITTNGPDSAKQSQSPQEEPSVLPVETQHLASPSPGPMPQPPTSEPCPAAADPASCETKPTGAVTACAETQNVASLQGGDSVKQTQPANDHTCETKPTEPGEADCVKQSQPARPPKGFVMVQPRARYAWHYHGGRS